MNLIIIILINIKNADKSWHFNILCMMNTKFQSLKARSHFSAFKFFKNGPRDYKTQLNMKFIMLINVQMPTIVGFLIFISMKNKYNMSEFESKKSFFQHFSF